MNQIYPNPFDVYASSALNPERQGLMQFAGLERHFTHGEDVWLTDDSGRRFLDAYAQYGALALGHNHPSVKAAINDALQAGVPAMVQPYPAMYAEALARELYKLAGGAFNRCVFTTSGAETVEAAIKLVRMRSARALIVSACGSYHGKTMGALAASDRLDFSLQHHQQANGFARVEFGDIAALAEFLRAHGAQCAGFIVEPIQGERGVFAPPKGYLKAAKKLCAEHGVAFIADEIQTGLFRTGAAFACAHDEVAPDILLVAKALGGGVFPLGACLVNEKYWDPAFALAHSSTFANNNIACAVGLTVLRELQQSAFQENLARIVAQMENGLAALAGRFPRSVAAVRGRGLMRALELREPAWDAGYFLTYLHHQGLNAFLFASVLAKNHGVLVLPTLNDNNVIRIAPPLIAQPQHIAQILDGLEQTLALWEARASHQIVRSVMRSGGANGSAQRRSVSGAAPLLLPQYRRRSAQTALDYAFIIHPTTLDDVVLNDPSFAHLSPQELSDYCDYSAQLPAGLVCTIPEITSAKGARVRGALIGLPLLPDQMLQRGREVVCKAIANAVDLACARGAKVVGLGAFTSIFTRNGQAVTGRGAVITSGNLLTAGMTFSALQFVLEQQQRKMQDCRVGIVGARGSVGALLAQLLARASPREIVLVGNPNSDVAAIDRVAARLKGLGRAAMTTSNKIALLEHCDVIISASSSTRPILDALSLCISPGTVICDVARPFDTSSAMRARHDITVIDAGLVALPGAPQRIGAGNLQGHPPGVTLACLSETILLALAGATHDHGIGDNIGIAQVDAILDLAKQHGFALAMHGLTARHPRATGYGDVSHAAHPGAAVDCETA